MMPVRNLFVATLALSHYATGGKRADLLRELRGIDATTSADLPVCRGQKEDQFYNIDILVTNLPDQCNIELHLESIGFLIQDVVSEVENLMPEYKGEYMDTKMCLLPVVNTTARRLQLATGTYTYRGTGRCRRCSTSNSYRRLRQNRFLPLFGSGQRHLQSDCLIETETVTIQKGLAEAAINISDTALFDLTEMAQAFRQSEEVKSIITLAESTNRRVKEESRLTSTSANLTISWCWRAANTRLKSRISEYQSNAQKEMKETIDAAGRARNALEQVKGAKRDMEELIFMLAGGPEIKELETTLMEQKAELDKQIENIDAESANIDAALAALDVNVTVIYPESTWEDRIAEIQAEIEHVKILLEAVDSSNETGAIGTNADKQVNTTSGVVEQKVLLERKATLLQEALRLEQAVQSNQELTRQSSEARESLYTKSRNYTTDPVLQYALQRVGGDFFGSGSNWDSGASTKPTSTREEWFAKFARLLITEIPNRLESTYNTTNGGCIDVSLDMSVIITELESWKEQSTLCIYEAMLMPSPIQPAAVTVPSSVASPTSSPTTNPTAAQPAPTLGPTKRPTGAPPPTPTETPTARPTLMATSLPMPALTLGRTKTTTIPTATPTSSPTVTPTATRTSSPLQPTSPKAIIYHSTECKNQDKNLGTRFGTPEKCAAAARLDESCHGDKIMWSDTYNYDWGCRCCSANEGLSSHTLWDVYQYKEEQMLPPTTAAAPPAPKLGPTKSPTKAPTPNPTSAPTARPTSKQTSSPTPAPTLGPTKSPTGAPTRSPTSAPTARRTPPPIPTVTFKYDKMKCRDRDKNLGTRFRTPEECGAAARLDEDCGGDLISWSDTKNNKEGCSCCSDDADFSFNQPDWDIYQYK